MSNRPPKAPTLTPVQQQHLRQKLESIMRAIQGGQLPQANAALQPLLRKHPAIPEINHVAAALNAAMRENDRALYYAQRAVELSPDTAEYHAGLGSLLTRLERYDEAIAALQHAMSLAPSLTTALVPLATAQMQSGRIDEARATFKRVLAAQPANLEAANNLALLESDLGYADRAIEIINHALDHHPEHPVLLDALCMFACYSDTLTPEQVADIHRRFGRSVQSRVRVPARYPHTPDPERRIKLGFVSPDLRTHSIAYFIQPIIEHLDRERFEVHLYHTSRHTDSMSAALRDSCDHWHECHKGLADTNRQIASDQIDILVELNGHFAGNLLPLFGAKPSPVAVTMIGYANTTGLTTIDARIIDNTTDPAPEADAWASEQLIRVPGCFLCYRPPTDAPACAEPDANRPFTFGSFNDLRKMSPSNLEAWAQILKQCNGATLLLKTSRLSEAPAQRDLLERFKALGIDESRIELMGRTESMRDHLDLYNRIDLALDTFPYTGTTTTCEAMHMGVPTLTRMGESHAARVSASLLSAIDAPEWIVQDTDRYIQRAREAYDQGKRPRAQRETLRSQLASSPLCDEQRYTVNIADALDACWRKWCNAQGGA
ncbi:MAG: tetratricopeptide repeat protein [Phycisphaerales bacterium]